MDSPVLYRIGVINDFKNAWCFVDYKKFGEVTSVVALLNKCQHKGFDEKDDAIHIFINLKKCLITKDKKTALLFINDIINTSPGNSMKEFNLHRDYFERAIL